MANLFCPACQRSGRRNANEAVLILRDGKECRRCGFKYTKAEEKGPKNYRAIAKRAWVTRRGRYGPRGMRPP